MNNLNIVLSRMVAVLTMLFGALSTTLASDRFYVDAVNFEPGETKQIAFNLDNSQDFYGFQADITLPEGLEFVKNNDKAEVVFSSRFGSSFSQLSNLLSYNTLRVGAFSTDHTSISENTGSLFYVNVHATENFEGGELKISDILFVDSSNRDVEFPDYVSGITTKHNNQFYIPDFKIAVGETKDISIVLKNETSFSAFQTDIYLPKGLSIQDHSWTVTNRGSDHSVSAKAFSDGRVRLACISLTNKPFSGNDGALISLKITADKDVTESCKIELKNQRFSMSNAKEYVIPNSVTEVTTERALVENIILSHSSASMVTGENLQLSADVLPVYASTKELQWTSSNPDVAMVNENGLVSALTPGETTITASAVDGSNVKATCTISVTGIPVAAINLNRTSGQLKVGESLSLTATVLPANAFDKNIFWQSDNETIASVDQNGLVTALLEGKTNIIVTSASNPEVTATCAVEIIPTPVSSIELNFTEYSLEVGQNVRLTAEVFPPTASDKSFSWHSNDDSIAMIDNDGEVTAIALGSTYVYAEAADGSGVRTACRINVVPTLATGITIETPSVTSFKVGESIQLYATVTPDNATDKSIVWTTTSPDIVSVSDDGNVTALSEGEATIAATNSAGIFDTIKLTVIPTLAESITVTPAIYSMKVGASYTLRAVFSPETTTDKSVNWISSNPQIVEVDNNGNVSAISLGTVVVTAVANDGSDVSGSCEITVIPTPAEGISINYDGKTSLYVGEEVALSATITPENATDKSVIWESQDENVLTVDVNGKVKAIALGEAWVKATNSAGISSFIVFSVIPTPVTSITLNHSSFELKAMETVTLEAILLPEDATDKSIIFSSDMPLVATVDDNGVVTAHAVGGAIITATAVGGTNVSAYCSIKVNPTPVEKVVITTQGSTTLKAGDTLQLYANVLPETATDKSLEWTSSNSNVAIINTDGLVTAIGVGKAMITATSGDASTSIEINVEKTLAEKIDLSRYSCTLKINGTMQLSAIVSPETTTDKGLSWTSSNSAIATVDDQGNIKALQLGECDIIVRSTDGSNITASCHVTVEETSAESISISPRGPFTLKIGESVQLSAVVLPESATDKSVTWMSQTAGVVVDQNGLATAVAPIDNNWISATNSAGQTDYVYITVEPNLVQTIEVETPEISLKVGESKLMAATVYPDNASNKSVIWSSYNPEIASVTADGHVSALSLGDASLLVMAQDGSNIYSNAIVHVVPTPTEAVKIPKPSSTTFHVGETITLSAEVYPEDATDKNVIWTSSDEKIATVSEAGVVSALNAGTVNIRATNSGGQYDEITLVVVPTLASSLMISQNKADMKVGDKIRIITTLLPMTTTNKTLDWSSSDTNVAIVDDEGNITAIELGQAIITAKTTDGSNLEASCVVTVVATPAKSVKIVYNGSNTLKIGESVQLSAEISPETATDKSVVWLVQIAEILNVSPEGLLTAVGEGTAWVGVETANGLFDYLEFTVLPNPVERIELTAEKTSIKVQETTQIIASVYPDNATNKSLSWDSSNESVATVDKNGVVTGISIGEANINARATDGSDVINAIRIIVVSTPVQSISISADGSNILKDGETLRLTATVFPYTASDKSVKWSCSDNDIATVEDGLVTAHAKLGTATISATAGNGVTATYDITVVETPVDNIILSLPGDSNEILDGEKIYLTAQLFPLTATYSDLSWYVSDDTVLSVDNTGMVTAKSPGEAYVYAESSNGIRGSILIVVKPILVEKIELPDHYVLPLFSASDVKSEFNLNPKIYPENASIKTLYWTSSDPNVGIVIDNVFYATGLGNTIISCHAQDGSNVACQIEIEVINPLTGIGLNEHNISLGENQTFQLTATIEPIDASGYSISWISSDENVATVENGIVEAISEGQCLVSVIARTNLDTSYSDDCNVLVSKTSGIQMVSMNEITIRVDGTKAIVSGLRENHTASVFNLNGLLIDRKTSLGDDIIFDLNSASTYIISTDRYALKVIIP